MSTICLFYSTTSELCQDANEFGHYALDKLVFLIIVNSCFVNVLKMDPKLRKFAEWHGIDLEDGGSLLLAAVDGSEFTRYLSPGNFEEMGINPGDSTEDVIAKIRDRLSLLKVEQAELELDEESSGIVAEIDMINHVLGFLE